MAPPGRPTKLTPELLQELAAGIMVGMTIEHACARAGISKQTYYNWRARGRAESDDPESLYAILEAALSAAEGQMVFQALGVVQAAAGTGQWQAAAWLLERRFPAIYGRGVDRAAAARIEEAELVADDEPDSLEDMSEDEVLREIERETSG